MRFDLHLRNQVKERVNDLAAQMHAWDVVPKVDNEEQEQLRGAITPFTHTTDTEDFTIAGVDGSGDFPAVTYADSFVYVTLAQATLYQRCSERGLSEVGPLGDPIVDFSWIPEDKKQRRQSFAEGLARLAGMDLATVIEQSDYAAINAKAGGKSVSVQVLLDNLICPHASESANIGIQLRSTGELGAAARLLQGETPPDITLIDTTFSLPTLGNAVQSLFFEHLKRWCCVQARSRGVVFAALSKSHGLPGISLIEQLAREALELESPGPAEHWFLRLPTIEIDNWETSITDGRTLPPLGAVSYLVRFHRNTPVFRLDLDRVFWQEYLLGPTEDDTRASEVALFERLDYASHDQRCYGYPYPIKAAHDRASLTKQERVVLRKQIIDAAVKVGMRRNLFRDASQATGHA